MCLMVYLAADRPLPLIEWREEDRGFHVTELDREQDEPVRAQFSKPHVYYAGSQTICGCGFNYGQQPDAEDDPEDLRLRARTLESLTAYLERECRHAGDIELFACWDGDQGKAREGRSRMAPRDVLAPGFYFLERRLTVFTEDAP